MIALISAFVTPSILLIKSHPKVRAFLVRFSSDEEGVYMYSPYISIWNLIFAIEQVVMQRR